MYHVSCIWMYSNCTLVGLCLHVSTNTFFFVCETEIKRDTCGHARGGGKCPRIDSHPTFSVSSISPSPPTMPHPWGIERMNTRAAATSKSCLRGWFSSWFSGKMSWDLLHKGKCEVFQVSVNVDTWVWEPMAQRRVGSLESVALTVVPRALWRCT